MGARDPITRKWGYIDKKGKQVIPFIYDTFGDNPETGIGHFGVLPFSEGLAVTYLNKKAGYVDKKGSIVIPHQYESALSFEHGTAQVSLNGKRLSIDKRGKIVRTQPEEKPPDTSDVAFPEFEEVGPVSEGMMAAKKNGKWGYVKMK
jgi:hypothetical protein